MKNTFKTNCPICNSINIENFQSREMMFGNRSIYNYSYCHNCITIFYNDLVLNSEELYPTNYYSFRKSTITIKEKIRSKIYEYSIRGTMGKLGYFSSLFSKIFNDKSAEALFGIIESSKHILDIGCGNGDLIKTLAKIYKAKSFIGIDPYLTHDSTISENCKIIKSELTNENIGQFDLIIMNHSFEHMDNPLEILNNLKNIILPGAIIVIRIPVCDSYFFHKYKSNWVQLDSPRHKFIFSNFSMSSILTNNGFKLIHNYSDSRSFSYIASEMFLNNIALTDKRSFYKGRLKNFISAKYFLSHLKGNKLVKKINQLNWGDQRVFYIVKV